MINVLIADDNIFFATALMNHINKNNDNIRVYSIAVDGLSTLKILNDKRNIDILLLDLIMPKCNGYKVLDHLKNKSKYEKSCIVISGHIENYDKILSNPSVYAIIQKGNNIDKYIEIINNLIREKYTLKREKILKSKILKELQYLGYDIAHKGTKYLLSAIIFVIFHPKLELNNLEKVV